MYSVTYALSKRQLQCLTCCAFDKTEWFADGFAGSDDVIVLINKLRSKLCSSFIASFLMHF